MRSIAGSAGSGPTDAAGVFGLVVADLNAGMTQACAERPEVSFEYEPPPRRLAPHASAIAATVHEGQTEIGWGKFVLLYDPAGQAAWSGQFRVIAYIRAELEPEIAADSLIGQVGWSWLTEALDTRTTGYGSTSGTVTTVVTEGFGTKRGEPVSTGFELRASWSPAVAGHDRPEIGGHVAAWSDVLCTASGRPPLAPGVAELRPPHRRQRQ
jgi:Protein of unknown function (DUF3000)